jgi:methionyl-tRNA formyltransferase
MRAAFLGTPAAAIPSLAALVQIADVEFVVTQPDRRRGRGRQRGRPPVKEAALEWGIPLHQPTEHAELLELFTDAALDVAVIVAYGRILEGRLLRTTRAGFVNVHFSLLPRWRGAAPVERAIVTGDEVTGVSLMLVDEGLDTGPVITAKETDIDEDETGGSLTARLADLGGLLLSEVLADYVAGHRIPAPQIDAGALKAPRVSTADARLDAASSAEELERAVRAFHPRPGAWLEIDGARLKVSAARFSETRVAPGVIEIIEGVPVLGCAGGSLELVAVQPEGKRLLSGLEWANGRRGAPAMVDAPG